MFISYGLKGLVTLSSFIGGYVVVTDCKLRGNEITSVRDVAPDVWLPFTKLYHLIQRSIAAKRPLRCVLKISTCHDLGRPRCIARQASSIKRAPPSSLPSYESGSATIFELAKSGSSLIGFSFVIVFMKRSCSSPGW